MPQFSAERTVPHPVDRMLALVADVEAYPQFVPLCEALSVRERHDDGDLTTLVADMTVAFKPYRETFASRVIVDRGARRVEASNLDGPFRYLDTSWSFEPVGDGRSRVTFSIAYAFKSPVLGKLVGAAFGRAFERFADAFAARADEVYGRVTATEDTTPAA